MKSGLSLAGALVGGAVAAHHALRRAPNAVRLETPSLVIPRLPNATDVRILFLSDAHHWEWGSREDCAAALLEDMPPPDLIVWGGDYLGARIGIPTAVRMARVVAERFPDVPAVAVRGNAEHKIGPQDRHVLERSFGELGVQVLVNSNLRLVVAGHVWSVVGTDDPYYGFCDLDLAMEGVGREGFVLLVAHSPQVAARARSLGVDLLLSGHTHGGQVRIPGIGALRTQNPLSRRLDCGVFQPGDLGRLLDDGQDSPMVGYISRGLGVAFVPRMPWLAPRWFCPPEITLLTLAAKPGPAVAQ